MFEGMNFEDAPRERPEYVTKAGQKWPGRMMAQARGDGPKRRGNDRRRRAPVSCHSNRFPFRQNADGNAPSKNEIPGEKLEFPKKKTWRYSNQLDHKSNQILVLVINWLIIGECGMRWSAQHLIRRPYSFTPIQISSFNLWCHTTLIWFASVIILFIQYPTVSQSDSTWLLLKSWFMLSSGKAEKEDG